MKRVYLRLLAVTGIVCLLGAAALQVHRGMQSSAVAATDDRDGASGDESASSDPFARQRTGKSRAPRRLPKSAARKAVDDATADDNSEREAPRDPFSRGGTPARFVESGAPAESSPPTRGRYEARSDLDDAESAASESGETEADEPRKSPIRRKPAPARRLRADRADDAEPDAGDADESVRVDEGQIEEQGESDEQGEVDSQGEPEAASDEEPALDATDEIADEADQSVYESADDADEAASGEPGSEVPDSEKPGSDQSGSEEPAAVGGEGSGRPGGSETDGPQSASLTIEQVAPAEIQINKTATFEIHIKNDGRTAAQDVEVYEEVPQGAKLIETRPQATQGAQGELSWAIGTLEPGEERTLELDLMAVSEGELGSVARVHFRGDASVRTLATRPELLIEATAAEQVLIGQPLVLSIKVTNPGTGVATGVMITEQVPEGFEHEAGGELEYELGDLKPDESRELELTMTAVQAGRTANLITARGDGKLSAQARTELEVVAPALEVSLTGPKKRYLEREATYTVSVSNPGTAPALGVELVTWLPKGLEFVKADNYGQYDPATRAVRWSLEELPADETGEVTWTALPTETGEQKLLIEGTAAQDLSDREEQVITVEGAAAIRFEVTDVADPIDVNAETTYEIRVVNQGSKSATDVQLVAELPEGMKAVAAEGPVKYQIEGTRVLFDSLPELSPKADTTYRIRVQGLEPGDQRVTVQVLTSEMRTPVTEEESTQVLSNE